MTDHADDALNLAIFCDFENVALGARDARFDDFDMHLVLERLLDKGRIVVKRAYADWERYKAARRALHEAAFELVEVPHVSYSGKNSADIRLVVDALDLCYVKHHVDMFVIVSGDSDFSPLVSKLRENDKRVVGVGVKNSTSDLLIDNCDEFIYYDDLVRVRRDARRSASGGARGGASRDKSERGGRGGDEKRGGAERGADERAPAAPAAAAAPSAGASAGASAERAAPKAAEASAAKSGEPAPKSGEAAPKGSEKSPEQLKIEALELVLDVVEGLFQDREGSVHGSLVKQTLKRKRPTFSERFHGYRTFNELLEDAGRRGLLEVHTDEKSGGLVISDFGPKS